MLSAGSSTMSGGTAAAAFAMSPSMDAPMEPIATTAAVAALPALDMHVVRTVAAATARPPAVTNPVLAMSLLATPAETKGLPTLPPAPEYHPAHLMPHVCHYRDCGCSAAAWRGPLVDWIWSEPLPEVKPRPQRALRTSFTAAGATVSATSAPVTTAATTAAAVTTAPTTAAAATTAPTAGATATAPATSVHGTVGAGAGASAGAGAGVGPRRRAKRRMRIAYYVPHHNVTGGMKMLVRHMDLLQQRGHSVVALYRQLPGVTTALPPWAVEAGVKVAQQVLLPPGMSPLVCFDPSVMGKPAVDILMLGYFTQLRELKGLTSCPGPVVYWEQGHEHLFCDPTAQLQMDRLFHWAMHLPIFLLSVSETVRDFLANNFCRVTPVVPNAIDCSRFYPGPPPAQLKTVTRTTASGATVPVKKVLLVGNPALGFKDFNTALQALNIVHRQQPLQVLWVCQVQPVVNGATFPISYCINPAQNHLPSLFRGHDCFLFTSTYEAWGMPVLEAMASGVPVVTSQCHGVNSFCVHGRNALIGAAKDPAALATLVSLVLGNDTLAAHLRRNALETARNLSWDYAIDVLEVCFERIVKYTPQAQLVKAAPPAVTHLASTQWLPTVTSLASPFPGLTAPLATAAPSAAMATTSIPAVRPSPSAVPGMPLPSNAVPGLPPPSSAVTGLPPPSNAVPGIPLPSSAVPGIPLPSSAVPGLPPPPSAVPGVQLPFASLPSFPPATTTAGVPLSSSGAASTLAADTTALLAATAMSRAVLPAATMDYQPHRLTQGRLPPQSAAYEVAFGSRTAAAPALHHTVLATLASDTMAPAGPASARSLDGAPRSLHPGIPSPFPIPPASPHRYPYPPLR